MLFPKIGRNRVLWFAILALLGIGVLLHLLPFYFMLVLSVTPATEALVTAPLYPKEITLTAWQLVFKLGNEASQLLPVPFWVYLRNSLIMVLGTIAISLPITSMAAWATSKLLSRRWQRWFLVVFIGTLLIPLTITLIPSFLMTRSFPFPLLTAPTLPGSGAPLPSLRIWDTYWAFILPNAYNAFSFLLFKGYFDTLPSHMVDVARVDGAAEMQIFRHIVLPLSVPVFAVAGWLQFSALWDSYLWPLVAIQTPERTPASVAVAGLMNRFIGAGTANNDLANETLRPLLEAGLSWNGLMVLGILQTLPVFLAFLLCRNYLLNGIRLQGMK